MSVTFVSFPTCAVSGDQLVTKGNAPIVRRYTWPALPSIVVLLTRTW
jgi:hypothetical protein